MSGISYRVDVTHSGVRMVSLATTLIGALLGSFVIVPTLLRLFGADPALYILLSCGGGLAIGLGAGSAVERYLRGIWPSGRSLKMDDEGLMLQEHSQESTRIKWAEPLEVLSWHFVIGGARMWVPQGWYCVACQLAQDGKVVTPYAFMKPADAQKMAQWQAFPELISRKRDARQDAAYQQAARNDGQAGLWAAEDKRWESGAEMVPGDFAGLLAEIDRRVAHWPG